MSAKVVIIDCGMGNLFSVRQTLLHVGADAEVTRDPQTVNGAAGIVLPGVGAFGDAMEQLRKTRLDVALRERAVAGTPIMGICLGMQLLMDSSEEFGEHVGLGLVPGCVVRLPEGMIAGRATKIPQIGWNRICFRNGAAADPMFQGVATERFYYFVHTFYVRPDDPTVVLTKTSYGGFEYCSALRSGSVFGCQFHPERSAEQGLSIYRNFVEQLS